MAHRREIGKLIIGASILARGVRDNSAYAGPNENIFDVDISKYTHAILPREHGQLLELNKLSVPLSRRYPSREHCMQMVAFTNSREAILVIANDETAAISDWTIYPQKKFTLRYFGARKEPLIFKVAPNINAIAEVYRDWANRHFWMGEPKRKNNKIDFFSVASMSDFGLEKDHFRQVRSKIIGRIAVWFTQWRRYPFDVMYPDYISKDKAGFMSLIKYIEGNNSVAMPYINSLLFDSANKGFSILANKIQLKDMSGRVSHYKEQLNNLRYACPGNDAWRELIVTACENSCQGIDVSKHGVYLDMLAAASPQFCWSSDHAHAPGDPHAWQDGLLKILRAVKGVVMVEGCAEIYLNSVDYCLAHLYTEKADTVPLWRYVYGDMGKMVGWKLSNSVTKSAFNADNQRMSNFGLKSLYGSPWMAGVPESTLFKRLID
ncbi:MAG: DUF6259 domain-containing protein [Marinagarivorans sp.]